jgi:hypothetical protein
MLEIANFGFEFGNACFEEGFALAGALVHTLPVAGLLAKV